LVAVHVSPLVDLLRDSTPRRDSMPRIVVFTPDNALSEEISGLVPEELAEGTEIVACHDEASALRELERDDEPIVVADLRPESFDDDVARMCLACERADVRFHLVGLGDNLLPIPVAALFDMQEVARIEAPFTPARREDARIVLRDLAGKRPKRLPRRQEITTEDICLFTYTEAMFPVLEQLLRIAERSVTLLLVGETGTGKTTLARIMHDLSPRRDKGFHHLACGALPKELIESELFGHVRGAFTSADRRKIGRFEAAGSGTLLLDEIDILGTNEQAKLLRVIEQGEYEAVGGTETLVAKCRLIAASNVPLEDLVAKGEFRRDLYFRMNVLQFQLPSLRERPLDIVPLAMQFAAQCGVEHGIDVQRIDREFLRVLRDYAWPGNIRELANQVQRAVLFCEESRLTVNDLAPQLVQATWQPAVAANAPPQKTAPLVTQVAESEQQILVTALRQNGGSRTKTAKALGISRVGLYKKMRKHGLLATE
jgi:two-component system, NtrC family, response regulator AtoC